MNANIRDEKTESGGPREGGWFASQSGRRIVFACALVAGAIIGWLVVGGASGPNLDYSIGDRIRSEIVAPVRIVVPDPEATERSREEVAGRVTPVFDYDPRNSATVVEQLGGSLNRLHDEYDAAVGQGLMTPDEFAKANQEQFPYGGQAVLDVFARAKFAPSLVGAVLRALEDRLSGFVIADDVPAMPQITVNDASVRSVYPVLFKDLARLSDVKASLRSDLLAIDAVPPVDRQTLATAFEGFATVTLTPNPALTGAARSEARATVAEVVDEYPAGEIVAFRNQVVDARVARALAAIEEVRSTPNLLPRWAGVTFLTWVLLYGLWFASTRVARRSPGPEGAFLLSTVMLLLQMALIRFGLEASTRLGSLGAAIGHVDPEYIFATPFAVAPLVVALLAGNVLGLVAALVVVPLVALMTSAIPGSGLPEAVFASIVSLVAVRTASGYQSRLVVASAGLALAAGGLVGVAAAALVAGGASTNLRVTLTNLGFAVIGGLLSAAIAAILLPAAELAFGIVSDVRLLELANTDAPLLRELAIRAPGTHQHSYVMSSVATEAAKAIGANVLLVRIGAYYHDIGKLHAPEMFVENQHGGPNPHDNMEPEESARQIVKHVTYGLERAREEGLPEQVCELITGHHGTRTLHVFLEKAKQRAPEGAAIDESRFRYPGPKPQSRESAILMLADGSEAAVRSLDEPTREAVDAIISKIANTIVADKQLDECGITLGEFEQARKAIVETLLSLHHRRVKYPGFNPPAEPAPAPSAEVLSRGGGGGNA